MNRIDVIFQELRKQGRKALMPFVTAGDPDLDGTAAILRAAQEAGASVCEIGVPFSDPIADGPVIEDSMAWALRHGVTPAGVLEMVSGVRAGLDIGLVLMVSYSIVFRLGVASFVSDAAGAGVDGLIVPDLPMEAAESMREAVQENGLILSQLIAPTTPAVRAEQIARGCTGFVYSLSRAGVTGEQSQLPPDLADRVGRLHDVTDLPIAVGFGVSNADQVRRVVAVADAAIVGSAIMREVARHRGLGSAELAGRIGALVRELASGLQ